MWKAFHTLWSSTNNRDISWGRYKVAQCPFKIPTVKPRPKKAKDWIRIINKVVQNNIECQWEYDERITFCSIDDLHEKSQHTDLGERLAFEKNGQMTFLLINDDSHPMLKYSVVVNANLYLLVFCVWQFGGEYFHSTECATSAHTFFMNSPRLTYKDVVHILLCENDKHFTNM